MASTSVLLAVMGSSLKEIDRKIRCAVNRPRKRRARVCFDNVDDADDMSVELFQFLGWYP